jgi:predicted GNAT family N-acyltransferase
MNSITIHTANSTHEFRDVCSFRYRIYVEEMGRKQSWADHQSRLIFDDLDQDGENFFARSGDKIVGVVRTNLCHKSDVGEYESLYAIREYSGSRHPLETAVITRLMVVPELRSTTLGLRLAAVCFNWGIRNGITRGFIDCNGHLDKFFSGMGFRKYCEPVNHYDYGEVQPMVIHLDEPSFLQRFAASATAQGEACWEHSRAATHHALAL